VEVHDYSIPYEADDRSGQSDSSDGGNDGYPGYDAGLGILQPWPKVYRLFEDLDAAGNSLPCLPQNGGGARWPSASSQRVLSSFRDAPRLQYHAPPAPDPRETQQQSGVAGTQSCPSATVAPPPANEEATMPSAGTTTLQASNPWRRVPMLQTGGQL
jgi:hypothetical protein